MKKIINILKKVIFAIVLLYTYNLIAVSYNLIIPINIFTIGIVSLLDIPGMFTLLAIFKIFYWR